MRLARPVLAAEPRIRGPRRHAGAALRPKAKAVIWLFMTGGPSQVDTLDYKPELQKRDGQTLAGADPKTGFFTTSGKCLKSPFAWKQHGQSGSWVSDVVARIGTPRRRHGLRPFLPRRPTTTRRRRWNSWRGLSRPGYPSLGAWLTYGLGSANDNLPAFVVMHDAKPRGDDGIWSPGFLPKNYQPLLLDARQKESIANVARPAGVTDGRQKAQLDLLKRDEPGPPAGRERPSRTCRPASSRSSWPTACRRPRRRRSTSAASRGRCKTCTAWTTPTARSFGRQCLIARRLVERGVRFVQVFSPTTASPAARSPTCRGTATATS